MAEIKTPVLRELGTGAPPRLVLDEAAVQRAREHLDDGAVTPGYGPWRDDIVKLLNDALATELLCVLRYKRHYFTSPRRGLPRRRWRPSSSSTPARKVRTPTAWPTASCSWAANRTSTQTR